MKKALTILVAIAIAATLTVSVFAEDGNSVLYYMVDCGDRTPDTVSEGDTLGIYQSVTEQFYGADPATGKTWGIVDEGIRSNEEMGETDSAIRTTWTNVNGDNDAPKADTQRYCQEMKENGLDRVITYKFEVPNGTYDIEVGLADPWWCAGLATVTVDGDNAWVADAAGYWGGSTTATVTAEVTDGVLDVVITAVGAELNEDGTQRQVDTIMVSYITVIGEEATDAPAGDSDDQPTNAPQTGIATAALAIVAAISAGYVISKKH